MRKDKNYFSNMLNIINYNCENDKKFLDFSLSQALEITESKYGYIYLYDEEKKEFILNTWSKDVKDDCKVLNPQTVYKLEKTGIWGEAVRQRKEIIVNNFQEINPLKKGYPEGHVELERFLTIPIFEKEKIIAVVGVVNKEKEYDDDDLINLRLFMNIVFSELSKRKLINELKIEKEWSKNIINNAPVIIIGLKEEFEIAIFNHYAEKITGYRAQEVIGKKWIDIFIEEKDKTSLWEEWDKVVKNKLINETHQNFILTKNKDKLLIYWNNIVLTEEDKFYMVLSIGIDITKLYKTEEELKQHNKSLSTLLDIISTLVQSENLQKIFENLSLGVAKLIPNMSIAIYTLNGDVLDLKSTWPQLPENFPEELRYAKFQDHYHIKKAIDNRNYVFINDTSKEKLTEKEKEAVKQRNLKSIIYFPLFYQNKNYGVLIIGSQGEFIKFTEKQIELFHVMAKFASLKLEDINTHNENQNHIQKLEEMNLKQIELLKQLHQSEERFRRLYNNAQDIIYRYDFLPQPHYTYVNDAATRIVGYTPKEHYADPYLGLKIVHPEDKYILEDMFKSKIDEYKVVNIRWISKKGNIVYIEHRNVPIYDETGNLIAIEGIARDITERIKIEEDKQKLQEQLIQIQKMESIGMLAGGIAHDYNNMLGIILGYAEQLQNKFDKDNPIQEDIRQIINAAQTTKELTRQLLAFGRKQPLNPRVININQMIKSMEIMLKRTLREDIELQFILEKDINNILVDPIQMQQIILNLVVNARDAMPYGGKLVIETKNVFLDDEYIESHIGAKNGNNVVLAISDTGSGMDKDTLSKIFEPFFSTKEKGKGTGLGLSTVYGIVKQSGGNIWSYSELGKGTTFKVYFPATEEKEQRINIENIKAEIRTDGKKILLVEDEENLRKIMHRMLIKLGYEVEIAENGVHAISLINEKGIIPDCILTDVIMPQMNGKQLIDIIREKLPNIKVLFMSGYTDNAIVHHGVLDEGVEFIQKPFLMNELGKKLNKIFRKE